MAGARDRDGRVAQHHVRIGQRRLVVVLVLKGHKAEALALAVLHDHYTGEERRRGEEGKIR